MSKEAAKYILEMARHLSDADFRRELKERRLIEWAPTIEELEKAMKAENE